MPTKTNSKRDRTLVGVVFLDGLGFGIVVPILPFVVLSYNGSASVVTLFVGLYAAASFLGSAYAGDLSDRFGRRKLISYSLIGSVLAYAGMSAIELLPSTLVLTILFLLRFITGLMTGRDAIVRATVTDDQPDQEHLKMIATVSAAYGVGAVLGPGLPSIALFFVAEDANYYALIFMVASVASLVAFAMLRVTWGKEDTPQREAKPEVRIDRVVAVRSVGLPLILTFLGVFAFSTVISITALFGNEVFGWSAMQIGWVMVIVSLFVVIARVLLVRLASEWFGEKRAMLLAVLVGVMSLIITATSVEPIQFVLGLILVSTSMAVFTVFTDTVVSREAPVEFRGFLLGASQAVAAGALFFGAILNGIMFEYVGYSAGYYLGAGLLFVAVPILIISPFPFLVAIDRNVGPSTSE